MWQLLAPPVLPMPVLLALLMLPVLSVLPKLSMLPVLLMQVVPQYRVLHCSAVTELLLAVPPKLTVVQPGMFCASCRPAASL
jgi:hypothetical protein